MTNEEAIEILTAAGKRRAKTELFDALDMGIAALKNQERMQRELKSLDGIGDCIRCAIEYYKREAGIDS
jgi:hypothetical protein